PVNLLAHGHGVGCGRRERLARLARRRSSPRAAAELEIADEQLDAVPRDIGRRIWVTGGRRPTSRGGAEPAAAVPVDREPAQARATLAGLVAAGEVPTGPAARRLSGDAQRPGVAVCAGIDRP